MVLATSLFAFAQNAKAQSVPLPQSYQFNQKFNADVYSKSNSIHTTLRPFLIDSTLQRRYNELMNVGVDSTRKNWFLRKLFNEHLFEVNEKDYTFYADLLTENLIGYDFKNKSKPANFKPVGFILKSKYGLNTRGFQAGGTIGKKFSFYTSGYENQAVFADYYADYVSQTGMVPGQAYDRNFGKLEKDWSYVTAILSYTPIQSLNITLGQDKTFIGDGYRSILLSDYAANYPMLRVTANFGPVQYMAMWAYLQDFRETKFDTFGSNRRKWGLFHYADWNVNSDLSLGFFNAYIAPEADDQGNRRGFDVNFINPVFFASSLGPSNLPGSALFGFTGKYKVFDKSALYSQVLFDKLESTTGKQNTGSFQVGLRGADIGGIKNFNYLVEYNTSKPYTYADERSITAYTFDRQPMAHPFGANFKEILGILNYTTGRFDFQGQALYGKYGRDVAATDNSGKDVNKPFETSAGTSTGQGLNTKLYYAEGTVSYMLNPKYNLRFEVGGIYRKEKNALTEQNTAMITFGLRSSFRNLYHDF
ncbi:gliding motility protein RemB [Mucilaginibacter pallidiroseus]|uniref:Gliding motility protein RemB n=2 Tax=Mucilaginibacter pallidiroseus TaxID=2599295 RepID=A0A563U3J6_9SPHI|nr:gliding motility protein RemB [Mucilaginibacter pallidiroseus]